jgi:hypothetical protein
MFPFQHFVDVGGNPNINHDPPPAPLYGGHPLGVPYGAPPVVLGGPQPHPGVIVGAPISQPPPLAGVIGTTAPAWAPAAPVTTVTTAAIPSGAIGGLTHGPPGVIVEVGAGGAQLPPLAGGENPFDPSNFPGGRDPRISIMFDSGYTIIHQIQGHQPPWLGIGALDFVPRYAPVNWSIDQLIRSLRQGLDVDGWCITEVMERGGGNWEKLSTFMYGTEMARMMTLASVGWSEQRGRVQKPVWIFLHRA